MHISICNNSRPEQQLVENMEDDTSETITTTTGASVSVDEIGNSVVELDEVGLTSSLEEALCEDAWINDAT